eukprot:g3696.t1
MQHNLEEDFSPVFRSESRKDITYFSWILALEASSGHMAEVAYHSLGRDVHRPWRTAAGLLLALGMGYFGTLLLRWACAQDDGQLQRANAAQPGVLQLLPARRTTCLLNALLGTRTAARRMKFRNASHVINPDDLLHFLPLAQHEETTDTIFTARCIRLERIVSQGKSSPSKFWYDEEEAKWVVVLSGAAKIALEGQAVDLVLEAGDALFLPTHRRHRVSWTDPHAPTVWLALFVNTALHPHVPAVQHVDRSYNILRSLPDSSKEESVDILLQARGMRLEHIVSSGQTSPPGFWYDQEEAEWVMVLSGSAKLEIEGQAEAVGMQFGLAVFLPAHCRHRVSWTDPSVQTVWLALFLREGAVQRTPIGCTSSSDQM